MPVLAQSFDLPVPQAAAWQFFSDVERTFGCFPGCQSVQPAGDGTYDLVVAVKVGMLGGAFKVNLQVTEAHPPERIVSRAAGKDSRTASSVNMVTTVELAAVGESATRVGFTADVKLFGPLANFGWGIMEKKARDLTAQFADQVRAAISQG